jgi:beta-lactamase class A
MHPSRPGTPAAPTEADGLVDAGAAAPFPEDTRLEERVWSSRAMRPEHSIRTTAREMARLLRLIWRDEAGPAEACTAVRHLMAQQVTKHRLAMGFPRGVRVAAKSGSLLGVIRNEIGVLQFPGGRRYAAAVFTRAHRPRINENEINTVIGAAAALAVDQVDERW